MKVCPVCAAEYPDDVRFCPQDGQTLRAAAPATDLVGQVVADRYHVVKKLGEGGMGQVYLAEHVKMGRRSAIKVMNPATVHDPDAVARFNREAANASRITHPNVCAIYDFGETADGLIYLAMEFVEGEPLTDMLEREGALPVPRAVSIFLQVAEALQAAHDLGIVHRDLKPDNIMLTRRKGGGDAVKVVDFGIAKAVGGDAEGQKVTKTGLIIGTPEFMSPEQLSADTVDGRSDLYSLALVLYRMLTGKLPFEATTAQEAMIKRLTDEPAQLAQVRPDLKFPAGLQAVLDTALARSPLDRYQSVAKFAGDIAAVTGGRGVGSGPTSVIPHTRPTPDPDSQTQLIAPPPPPRPPARPRKGSMALVAIGAVVVLGGGGAWAVLSGGSKTAGERVSSDTAATRSDPEADSMRMVAAMDTGRRPAAPPAAPIPSPVPASPPARYDDAAGRRALDLLVDEMDNLPTTVLLDSAQAIYRQTQQPPAKAYAAYMTSQFYLLKARDLRAARDWIQIALQHTPTERKYQNLRAAIDRDLAGGRP
ncbi:MAG: serine/threonine-protein kinase [Gemmatimonadales bacterium]